MTPPADPAFLHRRRFAASCEDVFVAHQDPALLSRWWGPQGFTSTFSRFEFQTGGAWEFTLTGPDGSTFPNTCCFVEVTPPQRIVIDHLGPMHRFLLTITLEAEGPAHTVVSWRLEFADPEEAERLRAFIPTANEQNLDRLAAVLSSRPRSQWCESAGR